MSSLWNKTLFYLGLVDEEEQGASTVDSSVGEVRPVETDSTRPPLPPGRAPTEIAATVSVAKPGFGVAGRRIEPPATTRQRMSSDRTYAEAGVYIHPSVGSAGEIAARRLEPESHIIVARNFSDAQALADSIRSGRGVVLDLRNTEPEMVRRIVDFASGLTYALDGKMAKISQGVILITPSGVTLGTQEHDRLEKLGLFDSEI
ncbi:MAG: cell division protein SepF [Acidimicrobiia bacterium]